MSGGTPGRWTRRHVLAALGASGLAACGSGGTRPRPGTVADVGVGLADGTRIVVPRRFDRRYRWPAVVFLPSTGRTAPDMYRTYAGEHQAHGRFIAILPPGATGTEGYSSGSAFAATVRQWSATVAASLSSAIDQFGVAPARVVLTGFSLGGDLSWALPLVAPNRYAGTVVMGSRCGWRQPESLPRLRANQFRAALLCGRAEAAVRAGGSAAAASLLAGSGIACRLESYDGGHTRAPPALVIDMLDFALGGTSRMS